MKLALYPCTIRSAQKFVAKHHRHLPRVVGGRFAVAVKSGHSLVGVGIVGNGPRVWEGSGRMTIVRVCTDGTPNACSMIYAALCRAGKALGYTEAWTYTLPEEPGASLRASGFVDRGFSSGGEWSRANRKRNAAACAEPKRRWSRKLSETNATFFEVAQ